MTSGVNLSNNVSGSIPSKNPIIFSDNFISLSGCIYYIQLFSGVNFHTVYCPVLRLSDMVTSTNTLLAQVTGNATGHDVV